MQKDTQADRKKERKTDRQTDRQFDRQSDGQKDTKSSPASSVSSFLPDLALLFISRFCHRFSFVLCSKKQQGSFFQKKEETTVFVKNNSDGIQYRLFLIARRLQVTPGGASTWAAGPLVPSRRSDAATPSGIFAVPIAVITNGAFEMVPVFRPFRGPFSAVSTPILQLRGHFAGFSNSTTVSLLLAVIT